MPIMFQTLNIQYKTKPKGSLPSGRLNGHPLDHCKEAPNRKTEYNQSPLLQNGIPGNSTQLNRDYEIWQIFSRLNWNSCFFLTLISKESASRGSASSLTLQSHFVANKFLKLGGKKLYFWILLLKTSESIVSLVMAFHNRPFYSVQTP